MKNYFFWGLFLFIAIRSVAQHPISNRSIEYECKCPNFKIGSQGYKVPQEIDRSLNAIEFRLYSGAPHFSNLTILTLQNGKAEGFFYTRRMETFASRDLANGSADLAYVPYSEFEISKQSVDSMFTALIECKAFGQNNKPEGIRNGSIYKVEYKVGRQTSKYTVIVPVDRIQVDEENNIYSLIAIINSHTDQYFKSSLESK